MQKLAAEKKQVTTKILEEVSSRIGFKMSDLKKQSPSTICNRTRPGNRHLNIWRTSCPASI